MYCMKIHESGKTHITAICDEELIGKRFEDHELQLEVYERFYKDKIIDDKKAVESMKNAEVLNIIGRRIVNLAVQNNLIEKENISYVGKVPHAEAC